jgi:hypothetical protein
MPLIHRKKGSQERINAPVPRIDMMRQTAANGFKTGRDVT